jgi:nitrate/nitrite-specific signal transduction histidine kinase
VSRWLIDDRIVIVVEQDQSEALGAILTTLGINLAIALVALVIAIMLSVVISQGIARPLEKLAETATQIAAGDLIRMAQVGRMDEVGKLALAFNSMTGQLRLLINSLEQRVEERTCDLQRLALRLETSARVSREITSFLQIEDLIDNVTDLIQIGFGYYGVHIYLFDPEASELVFWGKDEMNQPHDLRISVGPNSLNGYVVSNNEALLVNDVSTEARYKGDENFPNTRSELVIPLRIGEQVIGTLDLLSSEIDEFQPEDVLVAQSLADQLAIAIENARLYERSQDLAVLEERNRLAREFHDAMNQSLYSVVLFAGAGQKEAENAGMLTLQRNLERIENMARQALK